MSLFLLLRSLKVTETTTNTRRKAEFVNLLYTKNQGESWQSNIPQHFIHLLTSSALPPNILLIFTSLIATSF